MSRRLQKRWTICSAVLRNSAIVLSGHDGNIHETDSSGLNAMMVAAIHRKPEALRWCIRHGVGRTDIDRQDRTDLMTALMFACYEWNPLTGADNHECAQILIEAGANPLKQNVNGDTALHLAVINGFVEIVKYLCSLDYVINGVGVHDKLMAIANKRGLTACDLSASSVILAVLKASVWRGLCSDSRWCVGCEVGCLVGVLRRIARRIGRFLEFSQSWCLHLARK
jgi:hypothetical protein